MTARRGLKALAKYQPGHLLAGLAVAGVVKHGWLSESLPCA